MIKQKQKNECSYTYMTESNMPDVEEEELLDRAAAFLTGFVKECYPWLDPEGFTNIYLMIITQVTLHKWASRS